MTVDFTSPTATRRPPPRCQTTKRSERVHAHGGPGRADIAGRQAARRRLGCRACLGQAPRLQGAPAHIPDLIAESAGDRRPRFRLTLPDGLRTAREDGGRFPGIRRWNGGSFPRGTAAPSQQCPLPFSEERRSPAANHRGPTWRAPRPGYVALAEGEAYGPADVCGLRSAVTAGSAVVSATVPGQGCVAASPSGWEPGSGRVRPAAARAGCGRGLRRVLRRPGRCERGGERRSWR